MKRLSQIAAKHYRLRMKAWYGHFETQNHSSAWQSVVKLYRFTWHSQFAKFTVGNDSAVFDTKRTLTARKKLPSVKFHFHDCRRRRIWLWSVSDCIFLTCSMWNILRCRFLFPVFVCIDRSMTVNLSCWNRTSSESCGIYPENNSFRYSLTFVNSGAREYRFKVVPTAFSQLFHVIHDCAILFIGARWHNNPDYDCYQTHWASLRKSNQLPLPSIATD